MNSWPTRAMHSFAKAVPRTKQYSSENALVWNLNLDQIESHGGRVLEKLFVSPDKLGPSTFGFEPRTVLYSKLRPYLNKVVVADEAGFGTTELVPLRCDPDEVHPEYLAYFLRSEDFLRFATEVVAGAKMPRMVMSEFWKFPVPIPPIAEQRRIAKILDQADALRMKRRDALRQLDSITQSMFIEMFGDPVANSKRLPVKPLCQVSTFENGDRSNNYPSGDDIKDEGILFLSTKNIKDGRLDLKKSLYISDEKFNSLSRGKAKRNDLIITLRGTLGSCCIFDTVQDTAFINAQLMIIRPGPECNSTYLHALLTSQPAQEKFDHIGRGAAVPQLTSAQMASLQIPIPFLADQQVFAVRKKSLDELKSQQEQSMTELNALFASLQHRAFRGKL